MFLQQNTTNALETNKNVPLQTGTKWNKIFPAKIRKQTETKICAHKTRKQTETILLLPCYANVQNI